MFRTSFEANEIGLRREGDSTYVERKMAKLIN
jgi:hypothetical protein